MFSKLFIMDVDIDKVSIRNIICDIFGVDEIKKNINSCDIRIYLHYMIYNNITLKDYNKIKMLSKNATVYSFFKKDNIPYDEIISCSETFNLKDFEFGICSEKPDVRYFSFDIYKNYEDTDCKMIGEN